MSHATVYALYLTVQIFPFLCRIKILNFRFVSLIFDTKYYQSRLHCTYIQSVNHVIFDLENILFLNTFNMQLQIYFLIFLGMNELVSPHYIVSLNLHFFSLSKWCGTRILRVIVL